MVLDCFVLKFMFNTRNSNLLINSSSGLVFQYSASFSLNVLIETYSHEKRKKCTEFIIHLFGK